MSKHVILTPSAADLEEDGHLKYGCFPVLAVVMLVAILVILL